MTAETTVLSNDIRVGAVTLKNPFELGIGKNPRKVNVYKLFSPRTGFAITIDASVRLTVALLMIVRVSSLPSSSIE